MSATLAQVATALETAAGATTSTNPNESGYWSRIAVAAEVLADATTSANTTISGYMLRAALALESIAGTSGAEENANYSGYLKRIVDALEVQSGSVVVGSLLHRLKLGAQNASFGPSLGPELVQDPLLDSAVGWTLAASTTISGGKESCTSTLARNSTHVPTETLTAGTYRFAVTGFVYNSGLGIKVGFRTAAFGDVINDTWQTVSDDLQIDVELPADFVTADLLLASRANHSMEGFSVKKIL